MRKQDIKQRCRSIKYELVEGTHTFTMCKCNRHGCRSGKCWECYLDEIFFNKLDVFEVNDDGI